MFADTGKEVIWMLGLGLGLLLKFQVTLLCTRHNYKIIKGELASLLLATGSVLWGGTSAT